MCIAPYPVSVGGGQTRFQDRQLVDLIINNFLSIVIIIKSERSLVF